MHQADKVIAREKKTAYRGNLTKITMYNNNNPIKYSDLIQPDDSIDELIKKLEKVDELYSKMANDISKKAEEVLNGLKGVSGATEEGRKATQRYADETSRLDKAERELQFAISENGKELARLRLEKQEANRMNKLLIQRGKEEIDMTNLATKSYKELSAQYSINKIKLNQMSAEERKAAEANNQFVSTTRAIYEQMKKLQEETGKYQLNVGNYENAIKNAIGANNQFVATLINLGKGGEEAESTIQGIQEGTKALGNTLLGLLKNPAFLAVAGIAGAVGAVKMWYDYNVGLQEATRLTREFTGMAGDDMKAFRNEVIAVAETFNLDFKPTLQAIDSVAANFGISFENAFQAVKDGLVAGADLNGDFLNKLQQYPAFFKEAGLSVEQFVAILTQTRSGIFGDKGLDAIKQANARIREMGTATAKALDDIGISSEQVTKDITSGVKTTFDVVQEVSAKLNELPDNSQAVGNALMDVFGKQGRDAGLAMIRSLKDISTDLEVVKAQTGEIGKMQEELAQANTDLQNALSALFDFTGGSFERMTQGAKIFFVQGLTKIVTGIISVINYLRELYNDSVLVREVWNGVTGSFKLFYDTFSNGISFIIDAVKGLVIALQGIYTFDYKRALEGIERFGKAIPTLLSDVGESIGKAINDETEGLNKRLEPIKIPVSIGEQGATAENRIGGGASGQMSLTLNLPAMIDATTRAAMITASTEEKVNAVYALVAGTTYYAIKPNASNQAVKALWDDAIAGGLIASQIILSADQINIAGKTIYTSSKTDTVATSAADTAAVAKRNDTAQALGYLDWAAMASAAQQGKTIIDGGIIRTSLIDTDAIKATQGFFDNIDVTDANLYNATIKSLLSVDGDYLYTPTINPNTINKLRLRGGIRAMFYWHEGNVQYKTDNIDTVTKLDTGVYLVKFNDDSYKADCFGYSLYSSYSPVAAWTVPTAAKASGQVVKQYYKIGIVTQIEEALNNGYKIIQNYTTAIGSNNNNLADFNTHALVFFLF